MRLLFACLLCLALVPTHVRAQEDPPAAAAGSSAARQAMLTSLQAFVDSLSAPPAYVREVWDYPRFGRLNPVEPPRSVTAHTATVDLRLTGIVFDEKNPARSAAIVRLTRNGVTTRHVVRVGETVDQYTVVGVEPDRVQFDVHMYGGVRQFELSRGPDATTTRRQEQGKT